MRGERLTLAVSTTLKTRRAPIDRLDEPGRNSEPAYSIHNSDVLTGARDASALQQNRECPGAEHQRGDPLDDLIPFEITNLRRVCTE